MLNPCPSSYTTVYLDVRLLTQSLLPTENSLVWSRLHNPIGFAKSHLTSRSLQFFLTYTVGEVLLANN